MAINVFSSPVSVALLTVPRGLLVTLVNGGVTNAHERASHNIFVTFCIATLLIVLATPELRNRFSGQAKQMPLPSSIRDGHQEHEDGLPSSSAVYISPQAMKYLAMASFTPLLYWFISQFSPPQVDYTKPIQSLKYYTHSPTVDIVISHYDEPAHQVKELIETLRYYPMIKTRDPRFIVYTKSPEENVTRISEGEFLHETGANEVYHLPNLGREAGTYIRHITRNYNDTINPTLTQYRPAGLADHTLFMQSVSIILLFPFRLPCCRLSDWLTQNDYLHCVQHLAWDWIAKERLWLFQDNTGYLHFAPYMKLDCGKDMNGNGDFPRLKEVYNIFAEELCPPTLQLGAYSSQFVVSKERIRE